MPLVLVIMWKVMIIPSSFKAAWWLSNAHAQTLFPTLARNIVAPFDKRERLELPDGDFIDLAWSIHGLDKTSPLVILLHGLGGSASSPYIAGFAQAALRCGWRSLVMQFRGASEEPNRLPRAYHSGETGDLSFLLDELAKREPDVKKAIVGVSLGGNVLLKWLGEVSSQSLIQAAVAVSVPFQLRIAADKMNRGFSRLYQTYLLRNMRQVFQRKMDKLGDKLADTIKQMDDCDCFWTFDDRVTAPLYNFPNVHAYYRQASSRQYLIDIKTPTLIIHALDDPFMTPEVLPGIGELSDDVTLEWSKKGGHVGFIGGDMPGNPEYWLDQRIPQFLQDYL